MATKRTATKAKAKAKAKAKRTAKKPAPAKIRAKKQTKRIKQAGGGVAPTTRFEQAVKSWKKPDKRFVAYLIALGDDQLVLAQNLIQWCGFAPTLEEDIALSNMGLDMLGQARELYNYAGAVEGKGRSEDDIAFLRGEHEYQNLLLLEQPNGDFAQTQLRQFFYASFMVPFWAHMETHCLDETLQAIGGKAVKEMAYHARHSAEWVIRLAQGTDESRRRLLQALQALYIYTGELFAPYPQAEAIRQAYHLPDPAQLKPLWQAKVADIFKMADITLPAEAVMQTGGRIGRHTENLGHLLADLQYMQRTYPGLSW